MSSLREVIKELQIPDEKIHQIVETLNRNPMEVMTILQELNLPQEKMQQLFGAAMMDTGAIAELAKEYGIKEDVASSLKNKISGEKQ